MISTKKLIYKIIEAIGSGIDTLTTTDKTLVGAINEVDAEVDALAGKRKTLWEGTYSSGTLVVPDISKYHTLEVTFQGIATHALCFVSGSGNTGYVRGVGTYASVTYIIDYVVGLNLDHTTDTLTWVNCIQRQMTISSKAFNTSALTITSIIGIE